MSDEPKNGLGVPRWYAVALTVAVVLVFGEAGALFGRSLSASAPAAPATATAAAPAATTAAAGGCGSGGGAGTGTSTSAGPFAVGKAAPLNAAVVTLSGQPTKLARGSRATVVVGAATWCLFTGYLDRWVMPELAKTPGVAIDIVDVSPAGGIADPGPENPPFTGHDGTQGPALSLRQMEADMRQYATRYGLLDKPSIHLYVATTATQSAWNIQSFPTWAIANASGKVAEVVPGSATVAQGEALLQAVVGK